MKRGIIRGNIVSTRKQDALVGSKFMEVQIMKNGELTDEYVIAIDSVGAGIGEEVLITTGSVCRPKPLPVGSGSYFMPGKLPCRPA